ncbi:hypothetical protein BJ508DRAFT_301083 [Ascobolus immersus RN42]|uniref:O-acyltransferase n=1 Tax=Ascobolus immersus RN42 TaxID=1160509 RepID=A0A3N4INW8_ASCIM|nr:hypothetical protein BJ508DRAFT_301083 [Ascobolus immersus RN42]
MTTPLALSPNVTISKASGSSYFTLQKEGTITQRPNGIPEQPEPVSQQKKAVVIDPKFVNKYKHIFAIHAQGRPSCLSHDAPKTPSFLGFRNLMILVLVVGNLRLIIENFLKYGVLIRVSSGYFRSQDLKMFLMLYALIPLQLLIAFVTEYFAAVQARRSYEEAKQSDGKKPPKLKAFWYIIGFIHGLNSFFYLAIANYVVYYKIHHPVIGTACEFHAIIVWLKHISYAFTNRDLRDAYLEDSPVPESYASCPYPQNITFPNLWYFWWAPTLVYQPVYPRSGQFRPSFFFKRVAEVIVLSLAMWFLTMQYAVPILQNSVGALNAFNLPIILERLMKLSTVSLVIWLSGFFALFQSGLNALAELIGFGDREFYTDWWNAGSVGTYWSSWNRPVYLFMRRHIYAPLVGRGWSRQAAGFMVFLFSAILHEVAVGVPTHNIIGVAFLGMLFQVPLVSLTAPLEKMRGKGSILGNCIFWISFVLVGQPLGVLLYYFAWEAKYGTLATNKGR